jgi:GNAT superfamily N-acetyltransferase
VAHARSTQGEFVGHVRAFSTFIGELVVHPSVQRHGVGRRLLEAVDSYSEGVPVYVKPFVDVEGFFLKQGYQRAKRSMSVLFKLNRQAA